MYKIKVIHSVLMEPGFGNMKCFWRSRPLHTPDYLYTPTREWALLPFTQHFGSTELIPLPALNSNVFVYYFQSPIRDDVKPDITQTVSDMLEGIIDEVIHSLSTQPSVASVVLDTIQDVITEGPQDTDGDPSESQGNEEVETSYEITDIDDALLEDIEDDKKTPEKVLVGHKMVIDISTGTANNVEIKKVGETPTAQNTSKEKVEIEIQEVKVTLDDDDTEKPADLDSNKDNATITINGQPVPSSGMVVVNGYAMPVGDNQQMETSAVIPQTDLDTFETKNVKDSKNRNISEMDDDQRSDTGSVNTVDSTEDTRPQKKTKKARTRIRDVSVHHCCIPMLSSEDNYMCQSL